MRTNIIIALTAVGVVAGTASSTHAAIAYAAAGNLVTENFSTLPTTGGNTAWANDSTLSGWSLFNKSSDAITSIAIDNGSSAGGSFYSFGTTNAADRALGGIGSGNPYFGTPSTGAVAGWIAVAFKNTTGDTLKSFDVKYDGEQWRGAVNPVQQTMVLEWGLGDTFATVELWTAPGAAFDFTGPIATTTAAALDGNAGANRVANLGGPVNGVTWENNKTLWIRWIERNDTGNDHGLAIDLFRFSASAEVPAPGSVALLGMCGLVAIRRRR